MFVTFRGQIQNNDEMKKQGRLDQLEEGRKIRQKQENEKMKLEQIKAKKLGQLSGLDIPDKYVAELAKKRIN